ncbi:MAG: response regulator [Chloroflexota bacterium]
MEETPRVCIVDDNLIARETLADLLYPENYELLLIESGPSLLSRIDQLKPDVLLLDVMMPGMNGFEVCQRLRSQPKWQHIPIILVTALDSKDSLVRGLDAGADEFISKPVNGSELRARVRSMLRIKKQYDELHAILQLREDLAHMLIHDMRTPLSTISLYTGLILQRDNLALKDKEGMKNIQSEVRHLESFVNDMLLVAKMEQDKLILNRSEQDLSLLLAKVAEQHAQLAKLKNIMIVAETPQEKRPLSLDANLINRTLDNLLSNALKFSPDNSTIQICLTYFEPTEIGFSARIQVIDEGPGIPEDERRNIFDKFKIISLKQQGLSQIGLGLALCRQVVEAHGGQIYVASNTPKGAIFTVEI